MAEIEVRTDLVWGLVTGAVRGAKDQATQNETAKKARELAEAAASEEARIEAEKQSCGSRGGGPASSCRGRSESARRLGYASSSLCARSEFKKRN